MGWKRTGLCALLLSAGLGWSIGGHVAADEPDSKGVLREDVVEVKGAHKGLVRTLAFHPHKDLLATGGSDRALRIWKPGAPKPHAELVLPRSG